MKKKPGKERMLPALVKGNPERTGKLKMTALGAYGCRRKLEAIGGTGAEHTVCFLNQDLLKRIAESRNAEVSVCGIGTKEFLDETVPVYGPAN